jgi:hypothetical protein
LFERAAEIRDGGNVFVHRYRITIDGRLGRVAQQAFNDFTIEANGMYTSLIANLDQAALFGALNRIQALGLTLAGLSRIPQQAAKEAVRDVSQAAAPGIA